MAGGGCCGGNKNADEDTPLSPVEVGVDVGPVNMEKLKAGLLGSVWPRCRCVHGCNCSPASIAPPAQPEDSHNFDVTSKPCSCVQMHLFAVPDDCSGSIAAYCEALRPLVPIAVKPGVLGVEGGLCSVPMVLERLKPFNAFHIPRKTRVVTYANGGSPLVEGVTGVRSASHTRVLLPALPKDVEAKKEPQVYLSSQDALQHAASLSLPLAKLRLQEEPQAPAEQGPASKGNNHTCLLFHIPTMKCTSCSSKIVKNLRSKLGLVPGTDFYVSVERKEVGILLSNGVLPPKANALKVEAYREKVEGVLRDINLPPQLKRVKGRVASVHVEGISCKSCVAAIKKNCKPMELDFDFENRVINNIPVDKVEHIIGIINELQGGKFKATLKDIHAVDHATTVPTVVEVYVSNWDSRLEAALAPEWAARTAETKAARQASPGGSPKPSPALQSHVINIQEEAADPGLRRNNSREYIQTNFIVRGMTCASCVSRIEDHLLDIPGVQSASVALSTETARVSHLSTMSAEVLGKELTDLGYPTTIITEDSQDDLHKTLSREEEKQVLYRSALMSLLLAAPSMLMMVVGPYSSTMMGLMDYAVYKHITFGVVLQLVTATPAVFIFGKGFFYRGWQAASHGTYTMDVLVALGVGTAYLSGWLYVFFKLGTASADAASVLVGFMLLGKYFEAVAKGRTADELRSLLELRPTHALLVEALPSGGFTEPHEIDAEQIQKGDIVKVTAGSQVPVDGVVLEGAIEVDQSMLTGESLPVTKVVKDAVAGGTGCVDGMAYVVATHVGSDSTLSQIIRLINDAQASKAPIQKVADVIAGRFVPLVLLVCAVSFITWLTLGVLGLYPAEWRGEKSPFGFAMNFLLATLVVACPCAMGLATPTAVMVSTGVGAKLGIFIKGGETIESAASVKAVLFDKTGTITTGNVTVENAEFFGGSRAGLSAADSLPWISAVESSSQHPVAKAVIGFCATKQKQMTNRAVAQPEPPSSQHTTIPGSGVECLIDGRRVIAGQSSWVMSRCEPNQAAARAVERWNAEGTTVVLTAVDREVLWGFAIKDVAKPEAHAAVRYLQMTGHRVLMVTGDNRKAAYKVAQRVGIPESDVFAEVLPSDKADVVKRVQLETGAVCFVGDGINDAPALAAADVGIALGSGTSVAIDSADAVLTKSDLADVATLLELSRVTLRRIQLNFVWAFGYNLLALPVAAGLTFPLVHDQLPPVVGGVAMVGSSLLVLTSSLLLRFFAAPDIFAATGIPKQTKAPFGSQQKSYSTF